MIWGAVVLLVAVSVIFSAGFVAGCCWATWGEEYDDDDLRRRY
jgi:nitrogen fixation-related uncharacterized protein